MTDIIKYSPLLLIALILDFIQFVVEIFFFVIGLMPGTVLGAAGAAALCSKAYDQAASVQLCAAVGGFLGTYLNPVLVASGSEHAAAGVGAILATAMTYCFGVSIFFMLSMTLSIGSFRIARIYGITFLFETLPVFNLLPGHTRAVYKCIRAHTEFMQAPPELLEDPEAAQQTYSRDSRQRMPEHFATTPSLATTNNTPQEAPATRLPMQDVFKVAKPTRPASNDN